MPSRVVSLNVSAGGVPKSPVREVRVTRMGIEGDRQRRKFHGGPTRALCLYALECIAALNDEGHPIAPGTAGENITVAGLDWPTVRPGTFLRAGDAEIEIISYTAPCRTIRNSFTEGNIARIDQTHHPGWSRVYARVLKEGIVRVGDAVEVTNPQLLSRADRS